MSKEAPTAEQTTIRKGRQGGECNRTVCRNHNARWYNPHTGAYYCDTCGEQLQKEFHWANLRLGWRT